MKNCRWPVCRIGRFVVREPPSGGAGAANDPSWLTRGFFVKTQASGNKRHFDSLGSYFGLATVDILPPAGLFHPVLPLRCGQKLTFPLCRTCVQEEPAQPRLTRTHYCPHSDANRTLRGTWSWSKPWKRGTPWSRSTKSDIFPPSNAKHVSSRTMSIPG